MKTAAQKMGIKVVMRSIIIGAPEAAIAEMALPKQLDVTTKLQGDFDYIHFFVKTQKEFRKQFPKLARHLHPDGKLWLSWPKAGQENTDLTLPKVIEIGYSFGLVESTVISINDTWSAIKFTRPKKGKIYNNSFGKLPDISDTWHF